MMSQRPIIIVGAFPPPVHGFSLVNNAMRERLAATHARMRTLDLSTGTLQPGVRFLATRLCRWLAALGAMLSAVVKTRDAHFYMGLSGEAGQWLEAPLVLLARFLTGRILIHHHSFAYIDRWKLSAHIICLIAGKTAEHVVLCDSMGEKLRKNYQMIGRVTAISNAAIMPVARQGRTQHTRSLGTLGYLSNISRDKGIGLFLDIFRAAQAREPALHAVIAGPFIDDEARRMVEDACREYVGLDYIGPVYGEAKERFFAGIDILVFPSLYPNEAEPLVVHESFAAGRPVILAERGCARDMIGPDAGMTIDCSPASIAAAVDQILAWARNDAAFMKVAKAAETRFGQLQEPAITTLDDLLQRLVNNAR